jgi:hypothetical protein
LKYGYENAGIEGSGGSYPVDRKKIENDPKADPVPLTNADMVEISKRPTDIAYEHIYKITRGI